MRKNDKPNRQPAALAAIVASLLMLIFGLGYRALAARLAAPVDVTPVSPAVLAAFPLQIGDWTGQDVPLEDALVRATDTDAHLNRRYSRRNGLEYVLFYVASGVKARDLMPHRPEVCYTGAGWTLINRRSVDLPLSDQVKLPCNVLEFSRGALNTERIVVLDYYVVDGQYCADVSLLRSKAWRGAGTVRYVCQVQIAAAVAANLNADPVAKTLFTFAVESASPLYQLFENVQAPPPSDEAVSDANRSSGGAQSG